MYQPVFVARERELARLETFLERALAGQGQVCFVTGEAGAGKTALVTEFTRRAQDTHADLLVAFGDCNAQTGIGDPYLPFREVLGMLTGDVEVRTVTEENASRLSTFLRFSGRALVELGPDLIDVFVPGAGVATRAAGLLAGKIGWVDQLQELTGRKATEDGGTELEQRHIFEQYTRVLKAMAAQQPLMLVLDDLQWADADSISLLFHLGRRIADSRILLVGLYRPDEIALGRGGERHPLEKVLAEVKRYFGDIWMDLGQAQAVEGRQFVDALLDAEPNRLDEGFRQALFRHTGGHPLFTVELLRDMRERGALIQGEEGRWVEGPALDWGTLPARVEGVIKERIGRLEAELRETLTVASVEGEDFTAEVVARVQAADERGLVRRLSRELDKQHRLVNAEGVQRLGRQRLSLYRFQHNLFQKYLYDRLDVVERSFLHEDVGLVLEELYGDQAEEIAVQLARHFVEAGIDEKAVEYLRMAGERARRQYANAEAVKYLTRALELTSETEYVERYGLLLAREKVYDVQGARESQLQDLSQSEELAEIIDDDQRRAEIALRRANYAEVTGDYPATIAAAQAAIDLAEAVHDMRNEAEGYLHWGRALWRQGGYQAARPQLEQALALAQSAQLPRLEADSLRALGAVSHYLGDRDQATAYFEQALHTYREIGDRRGESSLLNSLGVVSYHHGDHAGATTFFEQALDAYRALGDRPGESMVLGNLANVFDDLGEYAKAKAQYEQSLLLTREIEDRRGEGMVLGNLGLVHYRLGDYAGAKAYYERALPIHQEIGNRKSESLVQTYLGLLFHRLDDNESAHDFCREALLIAEEVGDPSCMSDALTGLGHCLTGMGYPAEAIDAYQQALTLREELGEVHLAMESLAGLARAYLAQGNLTQAQTHVEEILNQLETHTLEGTNEPFRVYLTCYEVLKVNGDPRAQEILYTAYDLLQERAAKIDDEELRRSFLENVPANRDIVREWANKE